MPLPKAAAQVDWLDALGVGVARRVEETAATVQQTYSLQPARDGLALLKRPQDHPGQLSEPRGAARAPGTARAR